MKNSRLSSLKARLVLISAALSFMLLLALCLAILLPAEAWAGEPKPVPRMQAVPWPDAQVSLQRNGVELARLHFGAQHKRPFVFPVNGPSGRSLTRMGHPHDPESHSHHNSVWLSHEKIGETNFWGDQKSGQIVHRRVLRLDDSDAEALVETENAWVDPSGTTLLRERRRTTARDLPERGEWLLVIESELTPVKDLTIGQSAFGPIGVRMAKTIGVRDGGGTIRNSEGGVDEKGCFRLPARWVDYSGPIAPQTLEGITLFDHPDNPHHPVPFHVRDDGWMGASLTFPGALELKAGVPLRLRYALYIHGGMPEPAKIEAAWKRFAETPWMDFPAKK